MGRKTDKKLGGKTNEEIDSSAEINKNLGLDADSSSEDRPYKFSLNNDNERITHNPDGEDDNDGYSGQPGYSSLSEK